jgi:hypothetical protein
MRIRTPPLFRRYHIAVFVIVLLLSGLILMSLRVKQRQVGLLRPSSGIKPLQKATIVVIGPRGIFSHYFFLVDREGERPLRKDAQLRKQTTDAGRHRQRRYRSFSSSGGR